MNQPRQTNVHNAEPSTVPGFKFIRTLSGVVWCFLVAVYSPLNAEKLSVENLGVVERQARILGYAVSPGTKQYPPRLLISFAGKDGTWIVDLKNATSRKVKSTGFKEDHLLWPSFIGTDGKVFSSCGKGGLSVYDPAADSIKIIRPIPDARWLRGMAIGPDGMVLVSDYPTGTAAKYDPKTGKITSFGRQGGPFPIKHVYGYSVGSDGRYVYTAVGKIPWFVVAFDTVTGKQKNLLRLKSTDHPEVHQRGEKVFLDIKHGSPKKGEPTNTRFLLVGGQTKPVDSIPRFDDSYVPGHDQPQPELAALGRNLPIDKSGAVIKYRMPGQIWKSAVLPISGEDRILERIAARKEGRLLLSTGPYGNVHIFDPKSKQYSFLGNPASKHVYDLLHDDGSIYFCGYPNGILGSFDKDSASILGNWHKDLGSVHALFLVKGADGRIYSGNHNERASTGGTLGWYNPKSGTFGGIHFPNDDCEYLTTSLQGRFVVYASDFSFDPTHPEIKQRDGKLLIYDTTRQKIVREMSPLSDGSAGVVVETKPGILFGIGRHNKLPVMYNVEIATGKVLKRKPLSARAKRLIARGPDGKVYLFFTGTLVRIDPETFQEEILLRTEPGRMVFLGNDLYIAGTSQLRRIVNVTGPK